MKNILVLRNLLGTAGLIFGGYLALKALPELKRYIHISSM
jgi:hypothetical protein